MGGLLGKKIGMTRVFDELGNTIPVTVLEAGPCYITQVKTEETDGYDAIQMGFEEKKDYMKEGETYDIVMWESNPLDIKLPLKVVYTVSEAEDAVRGDTVTGATKTVTCETGLTVKVPIFIKAGDNILVNTETGEYVERVNI